MVRKNLIATSLVALLMVVLMGSILTVRAQEPTPTPPDGGAIGSDGSVATPAPEAPGEIPSESGGGAPTEEPEGNPPPSSGQGFLSPYGDEKALIGFYTRDGSGNPAVAGEVLPDNQIHWVPPNNLPGIDIKNLEGVAVGGKRPPVEGHGLHNPCPAGGTVSSGTDPFNVGGGGATYVRIDCGGVQSGWQVIFFHVGKVVIASGFAGAGEKVALEGGHTHYSLGYTGSKREIACEQYQSSNRWWVNPATCLNTFEASAVQTAAAEENESGQAEEAPQSWEEEVARWFVDLYLAMAPVREALDLLDKAGIVDKNTVVTRGSYFIGALVVVFLAAVAIYFKYRSLSGQIVQGTYRSQPGNRCRRSYWWFMVFLVALVASGHREPGLILGLKVIGGLWLFFGFSGMFYRGVWLHFGFPKISEGWRELVLLPPLAVLLAYLIGYAFGMVLELGLWGPKAVAVEPSEQKITVVDNDSYQPPPTPATSVKNTPLRLSCDFNAVQAGLGPGRVECDENGFPTFTIRWWNGDNFWFKVDPEVLAAAIYGSRGNKALALVLLATASGESTVYNNTACSGVGACGTWQFMPGTYPDHAESGYEDNQYRFDRMRAGWAAGDLLGTDNGIHEMYDQAAFTACFQGYNGCLTWNRHAGQAEYTYRAWRALMVSAGLW